jgi:hypothetical protein
MIIKVTYNKTTNELNVEGDVSGISLNNGNIEDTADNLTFEIAVDTTEYEIDNTLEEIE